jgi:hypothetical protein
MNNTIRLAAYINAVLLYVALFYSSLLLADTFEHSFAVTASGTLTTDSKLGSMGLDT